MKLIEKKRRELGWPKIEAARRSSIAPSTYAWIESGRFVPYPIMLQRIAEALSFEGDPTALLEEVDDARH